MGVSPQDVNLPTFPMDPVGTHHADIDFCRCWMSIWWLKWLLAGVSSARLEGTALSLPLLSCLSSRGKALLSQNRSSPRALLFKSQKETRSFVLYFLSLKGKAEKTVFEKQKSKADVAWVGMRG